jgi:predicted RNase H-like nuclease
MIMVELSSRSAILGISQVVCQYPDMTESTPWLAGVDGCPTGWIVAFVRPDEPEVCVRIVPSLVDALTSTEQPNILVVDIPIGLPDSGSRGGRAAENAVRPLLKKRQSSVFSIPSRQAVFAELGPFAGQQAMYEAHRRASAVARATCDPPRGVAIQAFMIFPKIREVDVLLRSDPSHPRRVFETHPEVAFWRLNGERALTEPKKVKDRCYEPGLTLRRQLLVAAGFPPDAVRAPPPKGAGPDDLLDAFACAAVARRIHGGLAKPFPDPPPHDSFGLPMAIWA